MRIPTSKPDIHAGRHYGMTLAEVMGTLLIASMLLAAVLGLYGRAHAAALAVLQRLDMSQQPADVLQLIAEDLDALVAVGTETRVSLLPPKFSQGYQVNRLEIRRYYLDEEGEEQLLESIIWQTVVDLATQRLTLYRAHQGEILQDRLLDRERPERDSFYPFVPVCTGLSHFQIEVLQGENLLDLWQEEGLPPGFRVTLSFAEPVVSPRGEVMVPEETLVHRTIAVDRMRAIRFEIFNDADPNDPNAINEPANPEEQPAAAERPSDDATQTKPSRSSR
jgi:hypothetical protein